MIGRNVQRGFISCGKKQLVVCFNQYSYYMSDELLREIDDQKFIFRNQSIEEGEKLRDILQPQITELREKIAVEFGKLYNI